MFSSVNGSGMGEAGCVMASSRDSRLRLFFDLEVATYPTITEVKRQSLQACFVAGSAYLWPDHPWFCEDGAMSMLKPLTIDIVSDVVCPWCYIGKRRIENALKLVPEVPVEVHWRPFFLNPWVPREGMSRKDYLTTKFGSVDAYKNIAERVVTAADEEGLSYRPELVKRQPNTIDCHRLIYWAEAKGKAAEMKQRLMELYFRDGSDLTDAGVLVQAAADCGLDVDDVSRRLATEEDVAMISALAQDASAKGISGVPTYVFAQKYAISGAQAPELLARAIRQVSEEVNAQAAE
jgi:predicted DsbA family dithiol-disulfide isomerase